MGYRPPAGIAPPQLEGKRTGRPKCSKSHARILADIEWAYEHRSDPQAEPPTVEARFWWRLARSFPHEFAFWVGRNCRVVEPYEYYDACL
jgi:hypothetical protein